MKSTFTIRNDNNNNNSESYFKAKNSDASMENGRYFRPVGGENIEGMSIIQEIFDRILTPLYGSQEKAINQIRESTDRQCHLLYEQDVPTGVLVYKTVPSDEFSEYGVKNSIEIKSLFVDHAVQNSGRGLGSALIDKLKTEVTKLHVDPEGIHVTVSETKEESLAFFRKKGFEIAHAWKGRYIDKVTEYLLYCPLKIRQSYQDIENVKVNLSTLKVTERNEEESIPELLHIIHNAHYDDIHSLKKLSDGTFISGSKDNSLRKWDRNGRLLSHIYDVEPTLQSERDWVTAVEVINNEYWVSGERSGRIFLWKTNGEYVKEIKLKLPTKSGHISQPLNALRVNCIAAGLNPNKPSMFVGLPTMFDEYNFIEGRTDAYNVVHSNDWVYCIQPLSPSKVFVVIGCAVKIFERQSDNWSEGTVVLPEPKKIRQIRNGKPFYQRQFISSFIPLESSPNHYGLSVFGGGVKILDVEKQAIVKNWREHQGRIWSLENTGPNTFASSGEDKTVKIWDSRRNRSVHTIPNHIGQVTTLLNLDTHILLAGTCPEKGLTSKNGAEIRFYDLRKTGLFAGN